MSEPNIFLFLFIFSPRVTLSILKILKEVRGIVLNVTEIWALPLPLALTDADTASPADREIATCVLARTTLFLCDCQRCSNPHLRTNPPGGICNPRRATVRPREVINTIQSASRRPSATLGDCYYPNTQWQDTVGLVYK